MMMIFVKKKSFSVFVLLLFFNMGVSRAPNTASFGIFRYRLWLFKSDWILKWKGKMSTDLGGKWLIGSAALLGRWFIYKLQWMTN